MIIERILSLLIIFGVLAALFLRSTKLNLALQRLDDLLYEDTKDKSKNRAIYKDKNNQEFKTAILASFLALVVAGIQIVRESRVDIVIFSSLATFAITVFINSKLQAINLLKKKRSIEYYMPLVMERIVMASEAGLDIIPAIKTVVEIEKKQRKVNLYLSKEYVSEALDEVIKYSENGYSFDDALKTVANAIAVPALTHGFIHLGIAQKEGGELTGPLTELSDATQAYYQESIEEDLAKLPVKATLPLVISFAGLMVLFLVSPIIQIISFASKAAPMH